MHAVTSRGRTPAPGDNYFAEIAHGGGLSQDEEIRLAELVKQGDCWARNALVEANLRLVVRLARQFTGHGVCLPDLIQEANLGLLRAAEKFDPDRNVRFGTYACFWIRQALRRAVMKQGHAIRLPAYVIDLISKAEQARAEIEAHQAEPASLEQIAQALQLSDERKEILVQAQRVIAGTSTDLEQLGPEEGHLGDAGTPDNEVAWHETTVRLQQAIQRLEPRQAQVLVERFGLDGQRKRSYRAIGEGMGLSRDQVMTLEKKAMSRLAGMLGVN